MARFQRAIIKDITGKRFGKLIALKYIEHRKSRAWWLCQCDCGEKKETNISALETGNVRSCGCLVRDVNGTHLKSSWPEWRIWCGMRARCYSKTSPSFNKYGGRGIRVCKRWIQSFDNFISDMGCRPTKNHSIERLNNNGNYTPQNCKWATKSEQMNNRRCTIVVEIYGRTMPLAMAIRQYGKASYKLAIERIYAGWEAERAITTPKLNWNKLQHERRMRKNGAV